MKRALVLAVLLLVPFTADASTLTLTFEHDGGGGASWGSSGFYLGTELYTGPVEWADRFDLTTGPATTVTDNSAGGSDYFYSDGIMTFSNNGMAVAVVPIAFTISLSAFVYDPVWGNYGPGPVAQMLDYPDLALGPGIIDPALAQSLGIKPQILGGWFFFVVDDFYSTGEATPNFLTGELLVEEAPEPSMLLLGSGLAGVAVRRWRQRRA